MTLLVERDAHRIWVANSISQVGSAVGAGALPLVAVLVLDAGPVSVSTLAALSGVAAALLALPAGPWMEYRRKRPVMVAADLVRAAALASVPVAALCGVLTMAQLYVVGVLQGAGTILFMSASGAHIKALLDRDRRVYWLGRNEATYWTTQSAGPPLGGAMVGLFGSTVTLAVDAASFLLSALTLGTLRTQERPPATRAPDHHWRRDLTSGWRYLLHNRDLAPLFWNAMLFGGGLMIAGPLLSIFYLRELGLAPWQYGVALGVPCLGGVAGAALAPHATSRYGERPTLLGSGVARTLWTGIIPFAPTGTAGLVTVVLANTGLLLCASVFNPTFTAWRMEHTDDSHLTRVLTAWSVTSKSVQPACMLAGGALATLTDIRTALMVSAVLVLASALLLPWTADRHASARAPVSLAPPTDRFRRTCQHEGMELGQGIDTDWKRPITLKPVGVVRGGRQSSDDDHWGGFISRIELDPDRFSEESLASLDTFSHVVVVYHFHLVGPDGEETGGRRPRGREDWPLVGIFAQRAKRRPNRLGVTTCRVVGVDGLTLTVEGLDAMEGTPVLDLKPHMVEFEPRGEIIQPAWSHELMVDYFSQAAPDAD